VSNQNRLIRLPVHRVEEINDYKRNRNRLEFSLGREPTREEIARAMNIPVQHADTLERELLDVYSLDYPVGEDNDMTLSDTLESDINLERSVVNSIDGERLRKILSETLTDRERRVIEARFGLDGGERRTLEDISKDFGVTRERIRQIEAKAMLRLKRNRKLRKLFG